MFIVYCLMSTHAGDPDDLHELEQGEAHGDDLESPPGGVQLQPDAAVHVRAEAGELLPEECHGMAQ